MCVCVCLCRASSLCGNDCVDRESLSSFHLKLKRKHKTGNVLEAVSCFIKTNVSRGNLRAKTAKGWVSRAEELKAVRSQVLVSLDCYKLVDRKDFVLRLLRPGAAALVGSMEARAQEVHCMVPRSCTA